MNLNINKVVIVIPIHNASPSYNEHISFQQCFKILGKHPIKVVAPYGLNVEKYKKIIDHFDVIYIDKKWQSTIIDYNKLKVNKFFYHLFKDFEFVLTYELDAFIFRDELLEWCNKGYDYVGAPWIDGFEFGDANSPFKGIGNSGFSLRKVATHLKILNSFSYITPTKKNWQNRMLGKQSFFKRFRNLFGFLLDLTIRNNTFWLFNSFKGFEDQFWCLSAAKNFKWYKLPTINEAIKFSIEMQPERLYKMNDQQLPFGCHAWWKYDFNFWKPFIESFGYTL